MRLINADELKKAIHNYYDESTTEESSIVDIIDNAPTVDTDEIYKKGYHAGFFATHGEPERPQGEWITNYTSQFFNPGRSCSLCGKIVEFSENYCPQCGAKMKGVNNA